MDYTISKHAIDQFKSRGIPIILVDEIMVRPDRIVIVDECKHIYQSVQTDNERKYLYRIFVNICKKPNVIITGYKTSKIEKYEN
jgi:hypothetical protein